MREQVFRNSLILEIQDAALASDADVAALLRKAKVAAVKLAQDNAVEWIDLELDGYTCIFDELPDYRKTHGILKLKNPYHGLIPVHFQSSRDEELLTRAPINAGIGAIQSMLKGSSSDGRFTYQMGSVHRNALLEALDVQLEPVLLISQGQMKNVLERVISLVLNWSLALERAGILGEGMSFSREDREMAKPITQTIIAQNIGHLGDLSGNAKGRVDVRSSGDMQLDQRKIESLVAQARDALAMLPDDIRDEFSVRLKEIERANNDTDKGTALKSARNVLEGASGNLVAQGILGLIASILG